MSGRKPDLSVKTKPANGEGGAITIGAWWREDGKLRGGWDKRVKRAAFLVDDGKGGTMKIDAVRGADGKWSHYFNAWENREEGAPKKAPKADEPPPDFGDDDALPF